MRIVLISDTHGFCPEVPDGDVLIHAGDLSLAGSFVEIEESGEWFSSLPHKRKILIAGNHDWLFQRSKELALSCLEKVIYLENSSVILDGIKFYGSPVQPEFNDWAFNVPRGTAIKKYWDNIPNDTDVLITHGPPYGILDQAKKNVKFEHLGCGELLKALHRVKPIVSVFGHIHGGYGKFETNFGTTCYNASLVNEAYKLVNQPWVIEI